MKKNSKSERLEDLANKRKQTKRDGYGYIGDYHGGRYDCNFVSPYTKSAPNVDSLIFIMLQDWASDDFLRGTFCEDSERFGRTRNRATNKKLDALVKEHFGIPIVETYASNLFPFVKMRGMNAEIPRKDLVREAREFALPQIEIVAPRLVVALGLSCFNALRIALCLDPCPRLAEAVKNPINFGPSTIWCQAHTAPQGQNMRNSQGSNQVSKDWNVMAAWFNGRA